MRAGGIDIGSATAKAVITRDGIIISSAVIPVTTSVTRAAERVMGKALEAASISMDSIGYVISTGYGRDAVPFANKAASEIICHARGVYFLIPQARTIIDIGAQDSKVMSVNERGDVTDFVMNDKCAAGSGRFLEVMARALGVSIKEMGAISLTSRSPCAISSTCTVFAESEVISLRAEGKPVEDLIAGIHKAIATRIIIMGSGIRFEKEIVFTGGVGKNKGVKRALEDASGMELLVPEEPQITGALGASLMAEVEGKRISGESWQ